MLPLGFWSWLLPVIGIIPLIIAFWYDHKKNKKQVEVIHETINLNNNPISDVVTTKIERPEPPNRLSTSYNITWFILAIFTLAFGVFSVTQLIRGVLHPDFTTVYSAFQWLLFYVVFIGLPIWSILYILIWRRNRIKKGESRVVKKTVVHVESDNIINVFNKCRTVLKQMKAGQPYKEKPYTYIRVPLQSSSKSSILTVDIKHTRANKYKIFFKSDANRVEIISDDGVNQKNVNSFIELMRVG